MGAEVANFDGRNCEGAEVADGEEAVGAPAVVLYPDENFCMGVSIFHHQISAYAPQAGSFMYWRRSALQSAVPNSL